MKTSVLDPISIEVLNRQIRKATVLAIVAFSILMVKLWSLQILSGPHYRIKSEKNRIRLQDIPPFRGLIYDRHGNILVNNKPSYDLYVVPEDVKNPGALVERLESLVSVNKDLAMELIEKAGRIKPFEPVCLRHGLTRDEVALVETHRFNLPGVMITVAPQRRYIRGELAAHILGYLGEVTERDLRTRRYYGARVGDLVGKAGVELKWQRALGGIRGGKQVEVDAAGRQIRIISSQPSRPGANVYLTIDEGLQEVAEKAMGEKSGAVVAIDPNNGQILAMVSKPSFDPNLFVGGIDPATWRKMVTSESYPLQNRAIAGLYSPGSVFKIVVALAALEEGVVDPEEEIWCPGWLQLGNRTFRCWKKVGHGKVKLHRALVESCDVYFYTLGKRLGVDNIAAYARKMGLGTKTGFDLGFEKAGLVPTRQWKLKRWGVPWQMGETLSLAIGQSFLLLTPIQAACLISSVFNGGYLYEPQVSRLVQDSDGNILYAFRPRIKGQLSFSEENLQVVRDALVGVVSERHGTGRKAAIDGIKVAGKTGTAQVIALEKDGKKKKAEMDEKFRDHAWFVAIAPAEDPQIAVSVLVEHGGHGGSAAAPIARQVMEYYLEKRGLIRGQAVEHGS
ncbi:MAG: penicillin-binding protein 2 [Deltaproteobacteria bacterium]|nr:MAG: penicillin-binding protein 2 [Deltaproteobacteria bacterium]